MYWESKKMKVYDYETRQKNQYFLDIESTSNNILDVFNTIVVGIFQGQILPKELLIIGQLDDYRDIEHILEPFCKFEGN